jgi:hypothetical protein
MRRVIKYQKSLVLLLGFFYSGSAFSATWQEAMTSCTNSLDEGLYCVTHYETSICSVQLGAGQIGFVRREYSGIPPCTTSNAWVFSSDTACPSPRLRDSQGACVCPDGQTWDGSSCNAPIVQDCPKDQYRNGSNACVSAPDCNASATPETTEFYFFNTSTGQCASGNGGPVCVSESTGDGAGLNIVSCQPLMDCIQVGQICSDNQANIDDAAATQPARNAAAKTDATASDDLAADSSADAAAAAAAKQAAATAAQQTKDAADSAAAQQQAIDPASQATADALATAAAAASAAAQAVQQSINSAAQSLAAATAAALAAAKNLAIESSTGGGLAENLAHDAAVAAGAAQGAAQGAIQGRALDGSPGGSGSGDDMGNCPGCAKESTLENLMTGQGNAKGVAGDGFFDQSAVDTEETAVKAEFEALITSIRGQIEGTVSFDQAGPGALPVIQYGTIKGKTVAADYSRFSSQLSWLGYTILFAAAIISAMIVFG